MAVAIADGQAQVAADNALVLSLAPGALAGGRSPRSA
jgi:hypothetical protein